MNILHNVLGELLCSLPSAPPEMGGILGGKSGIISTFVIDAGLESFNNYDHYSPNIQKLNQVINDWAKKEISFCGIFHSHFPGGDQLSLGDKKYIQRIMLSMPPDTNTLYFPLILPTGIIGYQANRSGSQVRICRDDINIL